MYVYIYTYHETREEVKRYSWDTAHTSVVRVGSIQY